MHIYQSGKLDIFFDVCVLLLTWWKCPWERDCPRAEAELKLDSHWKITWKGADIGHVTDDFGLMRLINYEIDSLVSYADNHISPAPWAIIIEAFFRENTTVLVDLTVSSVYVLKAFLDKRIRCKCWWGQGAVRVMKFLSEWSIGLSCTSIRPWLVCVG